ncbi:MAG: glycerol-3-phosphate 1-O-acyltransferase PlsY [Deltaproteobacteria bacterium]|jgi:glycerol-3-phosphate acyltransferase PlsY|nr:glycerol-3-phosphate 1-O-acyltransferase PlsY [Deltaproteobacteria bacterium]
MESLTLWFNNLIALPDGAWPLFAVLCLAAYLLGSVPFGLVLAKVFCGIDPRSAGSGNIGATNVARLCGLHWGVTALVCDALKGLLPTALALHWLGLPFYASLVGLCALLGHLFSVFLRFKGGKAVATSAGVFLPLSFWSLLIAGVICLLVIWRSGFVSLGSLTLAVLLPLCLIFFGRYDLLPLALAVLVLIVVKHRDNIGRLRRGEEKSFLKKKSAES